MISPTEQVRVLLAMVLCGALLGAGYDALSAVRIALFRGRAVLAAQDVFYGAVCAGAMAWAALRMRTDVFRWFVLLGTGIGAGLYRVCIGAWVRALYGVLRKNLRKKDGKRRDEAGN